MTEVVRQFTDAGRLAGELPVWDAAHLGAHAASPMQSRAWIVACAETFHAGLPLQITVLEDANGLQAMAPLVRRRASLAPMELLGVHELSEPTDFVYRSPAALERLLHAAGRGRRPLLLGRLPDRTSTTEVLGRHFGRRAVIIRRPDNPCPYIDLASAPGQTEALLSASLRSDLRRAQRKAEAMGRVTCTVHAPATAAEFTPLFEEAMRVEAASWKGRDGSALAVDPRAQAFFRRYGVLASEAGALRLAFLRVDGIPAAMQYAVEWNGGLWLLKVGYDERFAKCSPGMLLMLHTLREAVGQGLSRYEFLGSAEPWTRRWTNAEATTSRVSVYPFSLSGSLGLARDLAGIARRRLSRRLEAARVDHRPQAPAADPTPSPAHA